MKPNFAITGESHVGRYTALTVDTRNATYQGVKWHDLGDFGKRKFENFLALSHMPQLIKPIYV